MMINYIAQDRQTNKIAVPSVLPWDMPGNKPTD
jgi:hypothetical protein